MPNALTVLRIALVPVFAIAFVLPGDDGAADRLRRVLHRRASATRWTGSPRAS